MPNAREVVRRVRARLRKPSGCDELRMLMAEHREQAARMTRMTEPKVEKLQQPYDI